MNVTSGDGTTSARPGYDHRWFPWSPIIDRPRIDWPDGKAVAVTVVVDMGAVEWEGDGAGRVPPLGGRGVGPYPDFPRMSHREFGHRVGIFRLLEILERLGIAPAVAIDVLTAEEYPGLLPHLLRAAGEFVARGLSASRPITSDMTHDEEEHYIASTLARLEAALGVRPAGWMGPEYGESSRTPLLLADAGMRYVADWVNDEQPYRMDGAGGQLWAVPLSWELCDLNVFQIRDVPPSEYARSLTEAFDVLCDEASSTTRMLSLHLHPWLSAQPLRADAVESALRHIVESGRAWITTPERIVSRCVEQGRP